MEVFCKFASSFSLSVEDVNVKEPLAIDFLPNDLEVALPQTVLVAACFDQKFSCFENLEKKKVRRYRKKQGEGGEK
jgi:hypothetical protein